MKTLKQRVNEMQINKELRIKHLQDGIKKLEDMQLKISKKLDMAHKELKKLTQQLKKCDIEGCQQMIPVLPDYGDIFPNYADEKDGCKEHCSFWNVDENGKLYSSYFFEVKDGDQSYKITVIDGKSTIEIFNKSEDYVKERDLYVDAALEYGNLELVKMALVYN
jgi:hypothetical protein